MGLNRQTFAALLVIACLIAVPYAAPMLGGNYVITLATRVVILAIAASSLDLLIGRGALVSFGHAAYFGLGGYVVGIAAFHLANDVPIFGWAGSNEALVVWPLAMARS
jgi:branched-chain amino acid transport system permease protein